MGDSATDARSAEVLACVSMGECATVARSAEVLASVSMGDDATVARSAEEAPSVSMGDSAAVARSAGVLARSVKKLVQIKTKPMVQRCLMHRGTANNNTALFCLGYTRKIYTLHFAGPCMN